MKAPAAHQAPIPHILIVEPEDGPRALLVETMRASRRYRVFEASTMSRALTVLRDGPIDGLLLGAFEESLCSQELIDSCRSLSLLIRLSAGGAGRALREALPELSQAEILLPYQALSSSLSLLAETLEGYSNTLSPPPTQGAQGEQGGTEEEREPPAAHTPPLLWVGPEDTTAVVLRRACQAQGFSLQTASDAQSALRLTREQEFEAAYVFHQLPDMNSLSLVRSLRRELGAGLPIAYLAQREDVSDRIDAVHAGISLFLHEDAGFELLSQSVSQLKGLSDHGSQRILLVDDDQGGFIELADELLKGSSLQRSTLTSPLRLLEHLSELRADLLLINADMEGISGFELCRTLRAAPEWQSLPLILVGKKQSAAVRVAAFKAGADDYLSDSVDAEELLARLEGRLERDRIARERADRDALTGLLVRRAFNDALLSHLTAAQRRHMPVSLCLIDLDHFKSINDTYGHLAGDRVLATLGRLLSSSFRAEDLRGRWGGEEFVLAFVGEEASTAAEILARAHREFSCFYFEGEQNETFQASFSAGIASFPHDAEGIEGLVKVADKRLYRVKETGRRAILSAPDFPVGHPRHGMPTSAEATPIPSSTSGDSEGQKNAAGTEDDELDQDHTPNLF